MCVQPSYVQDAEGEMVLVPCHNCWRCRANRVNDLVGRCIAEQNHSSKTFAVTLTYRDEQPPEMAANMATLVYADFQKFMKRLRREGYDVRYIVAGEYGSAKGRAHWHAVLFFRDSGPRLVMPEDREPKDIALDERINWAFWPHGYSYFQEPDYGGLHYVLKYALKDQSQTVNVGHLSMSKKPPLGHEFFQDLAKQYVKEGLAPQSWLYSLPDQFDKNGKRRRFWLQGKSRENFLTTYLLEWEEQHGGEAPVSEIINEYEDAIARQEEEERRLLDEPFGSDTYRRTMGVQYVSSPFFHSSETPQAKRFGERLGYRAITGTVATKKRGQPIEKRVTVYEWVDGEVTYQKMKGKVCLQLHVETERARKLLARLRDKQVEPQRFAVRPKPMPRVAARAI